MQREDLAAGHRVGDRDGRQVRAEGGAAEARDQGDAEPGADEGQVAVELHRDVRDPGEPAGPVVHAQQPLPAGAPLGGGHPVLRGQVAGGDDGAPGQRVVAADDHLGQVAAEGRAGQVTGNGQGKVAPAVHDAEVGLPGGDQADGVPRLPLGEADAQVRVRREDGRQGGGDQPAHRGGERGQPHVPGDGAGLLVQPGLELLQAVEQARALLDEVPAVPGQHDAAADPLEQRHPGLLLQALDLLGHGARGEAERVGGRDDGAVSPDGAQRVEGDQVNHEAMLHG